MTAYLLHLAIMAGIYIILTISLNLIIGYAGQVSLGHAAFYGVGAYASALSAVLWGFPFPLALAAAVLSAAGDGVLMYAGTSADGKGDIWRVFDEHARRFAGVAICLEHDAQR